MSELDKAIAIVGIGCRFPKAKDADGFWRNIIAGRVAFSEVPKDRWLHDIYYSANQRDIDKAWVSSGSFIDEFKEFAALHYGIAPRRLEVMDPQQRLLIEATRWAIQDAGYETGGFDRSRTGVFVGFSTSEFQQIVQMRLHAMRIASGEFGAAASNEMFEALMAMTANLAPVRAFTLAGSLTALAAAAVSQTFDLGGPAYTIDSACASASVAIHDAMLQLRAGLIDTALAGGAYLSISPGNLVAFTKIGAISPSGVCRPFDKRSDGFVQSDGVGLLFLKRYPDAVRDGDRIHALIRGSGCNNDGRGEGPMTPRVPGQRGALRAAYQDAGFSAASVPYFEAHGTATSIGDPVEIEALGSFLADAGVSAAQPALIGSVKGNIGHAMSAAGIAGLVKALGVLKHRVAPPQPGFEIPNPELSLDKYPLQVPTAATPLVARQGDRLRVAVSSFGFGGTNSHIVLEEPPPAERPARVSRAMGAPALEAERPEAVLVTAPNLALLAHFLRELIASISEGEAKKASLADLAYTLNARRRHERYRAVIGARSTAELLDNLRSAEAALTSAAEAPRFPIVAGPHASIWDSGDPESERTKITFMFPGQGAQKLGQLADVKARFPIFERAFARLAAVAGDLPQPLASYVYPTAKNEAERAEAESKLKATEVCQPAIAALSLASAELFARAGVKADLSLGHSLGEIAALASAGCLTPEDAVAFMAARGAAMRDMALADPGAMAAVPAPAAEVTRLIAGIDGVVIANHNHPRQVSISGTSKGVDEACARLLAQGLDVKRLPVSHAFHSPLMGPVDSALAGDLDRLALSAPLHPVISAVADATHGSDLEATRQILRGHATAPVDFVRALERAYAAGARVFVQMSGGAVLTGFARATLPNDQIVLLNVAREDGDGGYELLRTLCTLAALRAPVNFEPLYAAEGRRVITLPETPLERQEYWPVKDQPQPRPELAKGVPLAPGIRTVELSSKSAAPTSVAAASAPSNELVELFARQAEILRSHAQIIAQQNQLLLGGDAGPDLAARLQAALSEPATAPAPKAAPAPTSTAPTAPVGLAPAAPAPAPVERPTVNALEAREKVFQVVSKVSAFPREALRAEQKLVEELGFDSLMVADLGGALENAYPSLGALPPSLFSLSTTVGDLAEHVTRSLGRARHEPSTPPTSVAGREPDATRYRVAAVPRPRPALYGHPLAGETWLLTEDGSPIADRLATALASRGAKLVRIVLSGDGVAAPARLNVGASNLWPASFIEALPKTLLDSGVKLDGVLHAAHLATTAGSDREPVEILHGLLANLNVARVVTLTALGGRMGLERHAALARHLPQATLSGYTKALARERPDAVLRVIDLDPTLEPSSAAAFVAAEIECGELVPEVGFDGQRWVAELQAVEHERPRVRSFGPSDVVLITGGSGEIGALIAKSVARQRPKAVVLVGRRPADAAVRALLSEISSHTIARYMSADVASPESFGPAAQSVALEIGQVTAVIHAAGVIEDALAPKKTLDSMRRVLGPKVKGVNTILKTLPALKDLILFSSWAGRFGNAAQSDYAAGNELLDRVAVAGLGAERVLSVVWPPWASSSMVRSIPDPIRRAMRAEGVTFLKDEEGLALFDALFAEDVAGIQVVGRALPSRELSVRHEERFELSRHPYLNDHRLKGRPVVPLASMTDLLAHAFQETSRGPGALVVSGMDLVRGVMGGETATLKLKGRRAADGAERADAEVLTETEQGAKVVAYRASLALDPNLGPRQGPALEGKAVAPSLSIAEFYDRVTFHGPRFFGIDRIVAMSDRGITGVVHGAKVHDWLPHTGRKRFAVDPLLLDAAFQLAGYWMHVQHGKAGFPVGFEKLVLLRPFASEGVSATLQLVELGEQELIGDLYFSDANGQLYGWMERVRARFAEVGKSDPVHTGNGNGHSVASGNGHGNGHSGGVHEVTEPVRATGVQVPEENYRIALFPEYEALDQRFQMAELIGLKNPYFHVHDGTARDTSVIEGVEMLHFSGYNYLGFSGHPEVIKAAQDAVARFGTSVSASRIASGERPIHQELEARIAAHVGVDDSIVFVSGHATNVTTVGHLFDKNDLILHDSLIHDSIFQGIKLSGAARRPFPHNDTAALDRLLGQIRPHFRRCLIVSEGIYSMDGDTCDLPRLIELKKRHKTLLMIDEAHSNGVLGPSGRGIAHHYAGVDPRDVDIWMGTLSKSFASCGGFIAGSKELVRYLKYTAPGFVYSAGITPANAAAALKSLELMHRHPEVVERLRSNSRLFLELAQQKGLNCGDAIGAAVVPVIVGNSLDCMRLSEALQKRRVNVQPIVYPAVEDDAARLRFFISALHTEEQLRYTVDATFEELEKVRKASQAELATAHSES